MKIAIEPVLYIDIQRTPSKPCPRCGGETYPPGYHCVRCGEDGPWI